MKVYYEDTYTYKAWQIISAQIEEIVSTLGEITLYCIEFLKGLKNFSTSMKEVMYQCSRFGVSSLPITLSIVGMTSIIVAMQVAGEMPSETICLWVTIFILPDP